MAVKRKSSPPGGLEPPTFRLTAERASQLRHGGYVYILWQAIKNYVYKIYDKQLKITYIKIICFPVLQSSNKLI